MSKKDYEFIAAVIKKMPHTIGRVHVACDFRDALAKADPDFNEQKFIEACGLVHMPPTERTERPSKKKRAKREVDTATAA